MTIETRPSIFHWITAAFALLAIALIIWVPILFLVAKFFPPEQRLLASCIGTALALLVLLPFVVRSGRSACWTIDLEGLSSPAVGRISYSDVVSVHTGYPRPESLPMTAFQTAVVPGSRSVFDQTLVLRLSSGQLLPLNLLSPSIRGGKEAMSKLQEILAGKKHSSLLFSKAELKALKSRPMNRIVVPKNIARD